MVTTTETIPGYKIVKTLGLVMAVGEYRMSRPRKAVYNALGEILEQAKSRGGNAIVGLRINGTTGAEAEAIIVYGTAVKVEKENSSGQTK